HIRAQGDELQVVAPVEGQLDNALVFDHRPQRGVLSGEQGRSTDDFHLLVYATDFHREINAGNGADLDFYVLAGGNFESRRLRPHVIDAGDQVWDRVVVGLVGDRTADLICTSAGYRYGDARNYGSG